MTDSWIAISMAALSLSSLMAHAESPEQKYFKGVVNLVARPGEQASVLAIREDAAKSVFRFFPNAPVVSSVNQFDDLETTENRKTLAGLGLSCAEVVTKDFGQPGDSAEYTCTLPVPASLRGLAPISNDPVTIQLDRESATAPVYLSLFGGKIAQTLFDRGAAKVVESTDDNDLIVTETQEKNLGNGLRCTKRLTTQQGDPSGAVTDYYCSFAIPSSPDARVTAANWEGVLKSVPSNRGSELAAAKVSNSFAKNVEGAKATQIQVGSKGASAYSDVAF